MRGRQPARRHDPDLVECRTCGAQFDLARQPYYGPDCPSCRDGETDE